MGFGGLLSSNMVSCFRRTRIPFLWALFFPLKLWLLSQKAEISVAKAGETEDLWSSREGISPFHQLGAGTVEKSRRKGNIFCLSRIWLDYDFKEFPVGKATSQRNARWSANQRPITVLTLAVTSQISGHRISVVKSSDIRCGTSPKM